MHKLVCCLRYLLMCRMINPIRGVEVRDRKYHLKTYKMCFVGKGECIFVCWTFTEPYYIQFTYTHDAYE